MKQKVSFDSATLEPPLTVEQFAGLFSMHPESVRRWIRDDLLAAIRLRRSYRIPQTEVARIMSGGGVTRR